MAKYSQKEAVYAAIVSFLEENNRSFDDGEKVELSSEDRKTIVTMIVATINVGDMEFSTEAAIKHNTPEKIRNYSTGLLSNWLRKDSRLNGGVKHSIKNPGSRVGQDDELIKSLKNLKKILTSQKEIEAVDAEIEAQMEFLRAKKIKSITVNKDDIPTHLLHLLK
jgi:hypothetical protein